MKKIIDGKLYDTDTAEQIDQHTNNCYPGDFEFFRETLYRTKRSKRFFIHGSGGPRSKYGEACPGGWCSGDKISAMENSEALEWLQNYGDPDKAIEIFGDEIEVA